MPVLQRMARHLLCQGGSLKPLPRTWAFHAKHSAVWDAFLLMGSRYILRKIVLSKDQAAASIFKKIIGKIILKVFWIIFENDTAVFFSNVPRI